MLSSAWITRIGLTLDIVGVLLVATDLLRLEIAERAELRLRRAYEDVVSNPDGRISGFFWSPILLALDLLLIIFSRKSSKPTEVANALVVGARTAKLPVETVDSAHSWGHRILLFTIHLPLYVGLFAIFLFCYAAIILGSPLILLVGLLMYVGEATILQAQLATGMRGALPTAGLLFIMAGFALQLIATFM